MDIIKETTRLREWARSLRNQTQEDLPMQAILIRQNGSGMLVQGLDDGLTPGQRGALLRHLVATQKPVAVVLIYEAWGTSGPVGAVPESRPSETPGAQEVMVASVETTTYRRRWHAPIEGGMVGDFREVPVASESGALTGLLYVETFN